MTQADLQGVAAAICGAHSYELVGRVGAGAFKETFHVRMPDGTSQALKVFQQVNSPERTEREIEAMLTCDHPNFGKLFSVEMFQSGGNNYLYSLEEYLPGGTLSQRVSGGLLSTEEARALQLAPIGHGRRAGRSSHR